MEELSWDSPGCVASLAATQWKNQKKKRRKYQEVSMVLLAPLLLECYLFLLQSPEPGNY